MKSLKIILSVFILGVFTFNTQAQNQNLTGETGKSWVLSFEDMKPYFPPQMQDEYKNASPEKQAVMKGRYENHMLLSFYPDGTMEQTTNEVSKTGTMSGNSQSGTWTLSADGKTLTGKWKDNNGKITTLKSGIKLTANQLIFEADPKSKTPPMIFIPMSN